MARINWDILTLMKKIIFVMLICLIIFPLQSAYSATVVNFAGGGPLENAVYAFQFEVNPNSGWTFNPGAAVPSSWEGQTTGSPIFFIDTSDPRENPLISGKQLGNFDFGLQTVSLKDFVLTGLDGEDLITISPDLYNVTFDEKMDTYTITGVPIPGAVWLLSSGLLGLVGLRRKFKKR